MNTNSILRTTSGLIAGSLLTLVAAQAADTEKDALPKPENYVTFSSQVSGLKGDKAAFEAQSATARHGFAGVEDLQYTKSLDKDYEMQLSGRALVGNADYLASFKLSNNDLGSFDTGYSSYRIYYDGLGGFFPGNNAMFALQNQGLSIDRSKLWAGLTLTLPNAPIVSVRYTREDRRGSKDTTIWGDTDFTYNPATRALANRKIVANYSDINETRHTLDGTAKYTVGDTTLQASVIGERINNDDTRHINRYPGESRPVGTAPTPTPWYLVSNAMQGYQRDVVKTDSLALVLKAQTEIGKSISAFAGIQVQNVLTDLNGDRPLYTTVTTPAGQINVLGGVVYNGSLASAPTTSSARGIGSYQNLAGSAHTKLFTANIGADLRLAKGLFVETALKYEDRVTQNDIGYIYLHNLVNQNTGVVTSYSRPYTDNSKYDESAWIPEVSLRYNGISKVSLYASASVRYSPGTESTSYTSTGNNVGTTSTSNAQSDVEENHVRYTVGANWSPIGLVTVRSELFYKDHRNDFNGIEDAVPTDRSQFILGTKYTGARLTVTLKPLATLSATTRYIYQQGTMTLASTGAAVAGVYTRYPEADSMDSKVHQFAETIDWNPIKQFYLQVGANLTFNTTSTAYPVAGAAATNSANDVIRNSDNNYWSAHALAGFVVDKATNAEIQYTYYKADNYQSDIYWTTPLGAGESRSTVTAAVKRKLTDKLVAELKVGYIDNQSEATGGYADYTARVAYLSLQQAF